MLSRALFSEAKIEARGASRRMEQCFVAAASSLPTPLATLRYDLPTSCGMLAACFPRSAVVVSRLLLRLSAARLLLRLSAVCARRLCASFPCIIGAFLGTTPGKPYVRR